MTASAMTSLGGIRASTPTGCSHDHHVDRWSGDDVFDRYIALAHRRADIDHAIAAGAASAVSSFRR